MFVMPEDIARINSDLETKYGRTIIGNYPKFRIVFSDAEVEYRKADIVNGIAFLYPRTVEVRKYNYLKETWVLERFTQHDNPELATLMGGSYEPVWGFTDKNGNPFRPFWKIVDMIATAAETGVSEKMTAADFKRQDEEKFAEEVKEFEDIINEQGPNFGNQTDMFVAPVFMDSTKQEMKEK
jgi:hypothetical protein